MDILSPYGVTLNVGRGDDGWSSIHNSAVRYRAIGNPVTILYFGDFDPSGEDMVHSLGKRLGELDCRPEIIKCALTKEDIEHYHLPPDFAKKSDSRAAAFIEKHGDISVELDAFPMAVLRNRIENEIQVRMDLDALIRESLRRRADTLTQAIQVRLAKDLDEEHKNQQRLFRERRAEVDKQLTQKIKDLEKEMTKLIDEVDQIDLFRDTDFFRSINQTVSDIESERRQRQRHHEEMQAFLLDEEKRIVETLLPKHHTLRGDVQVFPVTV